MTAMQLAAAQACARHGWLGREGFGVWVVVGGGQGGQAAWANWTSPTMELK